MSRTLKKNQTLLTDNQIVVTVTSRALFDLEKENAIFENEGIDAYRAYQQKHRSDPLNPGVAFPFVRRLLKLNHIFGDKELFKVVVMSRNSPETGERFFESCRHYNLSIHAGAFTSGQSTFPYLKAFNTTLFLSANKENVVNAIKNNIAAGLILPTKKSALKEKDEDNELRIAFDFDGVIISDESEKEFKKNGVEGFDLFESSNAKKPHKPGPLHELFKKLAAIQALDEKRGKKNPHYKPAIRISIVTARGAPSEQRLITTLENLGMRAAELFLLDGAPKKNVIMALKPHIFFDDQLKHVATTAPEIPSVLIPFGVNNF